MAEPHVVAPVVDPSLIIASSEPAQARFRHGGIPQKRPADEDLPDRRQPVPPSAWAYPRSAAELCPSANDLKVMMSDDQLDSSIDDSTWYDVQFFDFAGYDVDISERDQPDASQTASVEHGAVRYEGLDNPSFPLQGSNAAGRSSGSVSGSVDSQDQEVQHIPGSFTGDEPKQSRDGPSEPEWEQRKELILLLYAKHGHPLRDVMEIMRTAGFLIGASDKMYKSRFKKWGVKKNKKNNTDQKGRRPALSEEQPHPSSDHDLKGMIQGVRIICKDHIRGPQDMRWSLDDEFRVVENEWDDAFGSVVWFIQDLLRSPKTSTEVPKLETIYDDFRPMVEGLGFFTLPTILTLTFRMCDKLQDMGRVSEITGEFLRTCQKMSEDTGSPHHKALTQVLRHAYAISQRDPEDLSDLIEVTFHVYILVVNGYAGSESATVLSLVSVYLAYIDPESSLLEDTLGKLDRLCALSEKVNGDADDTTLDILGLAIFILQKTDQDVQLMQYCNRMKRRIEQRRGSPENILQGELLHRYLDVTAVLAELYQKANTTSGDRDALDLMQEYQAVQEKCHAKQDGYGKILEDNLEEVRNRLEKATLTEV